MVVCSDGLHCISFSNLGRNSLYSSRKTEGAFRHYFVDDLLWLWYFKSFVFMGLGEYAEWPINPGDGDVNAGVEGW
jgi:hypothetical protein